MSCDPRGGLLALIACLAIDVPNTSVVITVCCGGWSANFRLAAPTLLAVTPPAGLPRPSPPSIAIVRTLTVVTRSYSLGDTTVRKQTVAMESIRRFMFVLLQYLFFHAASHKQRINRRLLASKTFVQHHRVFTPPLAQNVGAE